MDMLLFRTALLALVAAFKKIHGYRLGYKETEYKNATEIK